MDHIPYTGSSRIGVPYIEGDDFDGGDFFGYPGRWNSRLGVFEVESASSTTLVFRDQHYFLAPNPTVFARCLQQWIFVGLYTTVLGLIGVEFSVDDVKNYEGRPPDDPRLGTEELPKYFQAFRRAVLEEITPAQQDALECQLNSIFHHAIESFSTHCSQLYREFGDDPEAIDEIRRVAFPVILSIEHCLSALVMVCHDTFRKLPPRGPIKFGTLRSRVTEIDNQFNQLMTEVGWCPSVISKIVTWSSSSDFRYALFTHWREIMGRDKRDAQFERLMQLLGVVSKPADHSNCSDRACELSQVDTNNYQVRHLGPEYSCSNVYALPGAIESVLQSGGIPICRLVPSEAEHGHELWKLEVQEASPDRPYTAISHVWSQGLGNPNENTLPMCQLTRIQGLVNMASHHIATESWDGSVYHLSKDNQWFWMDTLCVPVQPDAKELRKQAIRRMRQTYQDAQLSLALDTTLMRTPITDECLNPMDPAAFLVFAQILSSPWSGRLWTLQESLLAKRVYLVFGGDGSYLSMLDMDDIFHTLGCTAAAQVSQRGSMVSNQACNFMKTLRKVDPTTKVELGSIFGALAHRSTSRRSDETLCIASLLDLDPGPLLEVGSDDSTMSEDALADARMVQLLRCMREIPSNILFSPTPRLSIPNFTWAPRSFLGSCFSTQRMKQGVLTPAGLELTLDGIILSDEEQMVLTNDTTLSAGDRLVEAGAPINGLLMVKETGSLGASWSAEPSLRRRGGKALILGVENRTEMSSAAVFVTLSADAPSEPRLCVDFGSVSQVVDERWSERRAAGTFDFRRFMEQSGGPIPIGFLIKGIKWCIR